MKYINKNTLEVIDSDKLDDNLENYQAIGEFFQEARQHIKGLYEELEEAQEIAHAEDRSHEYEKEKCRDRVGKFHHNHHWQKAHRIEVAIQDHEQLLDMIKQDYDITEEEASANL